MTRTPESTPISRVALITSSFAPHVGGVETHVDRAACGLVASGHEIEVWTVDQGGRGGHIPGATVRYLPAPLPAASVVAMSRFAGHGPRAWRKWSAAHRSFVPDVLHVHCFGPNGLYALALARRFRTPLIVTSHGETRADDGGAFGVSAQLRGGLRQALRQAAAVTAPSEFVLDDLRTSYGLKGGVVIPNGVDNNVSGLRDLQSNTTGEPYFLAIGRLGWMKGFDLLLHAFATAELDPAVSLKIAGEGPERERLSQLAGSLGISGRVTFVGWLDSRGVADAMADAVGLVVPSRVEAFGIVVLEAWREGLPVIATSHGGTQEFVTDGIDGLIVDPLDTVALASALVRVSADPGLRTRLSAAASARVGDFAWSRVAELYAGEYRRLEEPRGE